MEIVMKETGPCKVLDFENLQCFCTKLSKVLYLLNQMEIKMSSVWPH